MSKLTVKEIEKRLKSVVEENDPFLKEVRLDNRKGVQILLKRWQNRNDQKKKQIEKFRSMTYFEQEARKAGYRLIAGIDEVGRGPLAGPVVAAAVILPVSFILLGLDDSKKLTEQQRDQYYEYIKEHALAIGIGQVDAAEIDRMNIYEATKQAMISAINNLEIAPDFLLIDAMKLPTPYRSQSIIKGDGKSISIAAASVVAKVTRDRFMKKIGKEYPQYHFEKNAGYGTKEHLRAIEKYGITPYHRKSFAPIKEHLSASESIFQDTILF